MKSSSIRTVDFSFFLPSLRGGGAERVMLDLAVGFAERGFTVDLVLVKAEGVFLQNVPENVHVIDLGAGRVITSLLSLAKYIKIFKPKALLSTMGHANLVAVLAGKLAGRTTRVVIREATTGSHPVYRMQSPIRSRILRLLTRWIYPKAAGIIAVSRGVCEDLARSLELPLERFQIIYNPVISPELIGKGCEPVSHPWFQERDIPVILSVGRLSPEKDFSLLLRAFAGVTKHHPARLVILGEGKERVSLEKEIRMLGIEKLVDLPGFVENPFAFMSRASVYVLSSVCEGLPNALIQASALGVPVVATDCPSGPREILCDGRFGTLVPVGDESAMVKAILNSLTSEVRLMPEYALQAFESQGVLDSYQCLLAGDSEEQ